SRGLAGDVPRPEQVYDELATIRRDKRRAEDAALDEPRPGTRLALPDERPAGPHDREGEWFDHGHRALLHRTTPRGTVASGTDIGRDRLGHSLASSRRSTRPGGGIRRGKPEARDRPRIRPDVSRAVQARDPKARGPLRCRRLHGRRLDREAGRAR